LESKSFSRFCVSSMDMINAYASHLFKALPKGAKK
jgi:hypothetical protein